MEDKKHGGARKGAGRKPKTDEEKSKEIILKALKKKFRKSTDEESIVASLLAYLDYKEGLKYVNEFLLGKPKEKIQANVSNDGETPIIQIIKPNDKD